MKRGSRYLPAHGRARRTMGVFGLGLAAVLSLVWGQQATLASFVDGEFAGATFTADTLDRIPPQVAATHASSVELNWNPATGNWATPSYTLASASSAGGAGAYTTYTGGSTSYTHDKTNAAPSTGNLPFVAVAAGATHACGIVRGQVYCWGTSTVGALGGATSPAANPTVVSGLSGKLSTAVSAGTNRSCAIAEGSVYCWGTGIGANPTAITGISGTPTSVSSGGNQSCAVAAGKVYCWTGTAATQVVGQLASRTAASVSVGTAHACAVADGLALCWGTNTSGQLGDSTYTNRATPVYAVGGELTGRLVSQVSAGDTHTCAVANGGAYCWGAGGSGRLGNGTTTTTNTAVAVSGIGATVTAVSAGFTHSCALSAGDVYCWGSSPANGAAANTSTAAAVQTGALQGRTLTALSAGNGFTCAAGDSPVACWGSGAVAPSATPTDETLIGPTCADGAVRRSDASCSLTQGTDYYYRLGYTIGSWTALDSDWVRATTNTRAPVVPAVTSRSRTALTLGWDGAAESGQSYGQYVVQRSTSSSGAAAVTIDTTGATTTTDSGGLGFSRSFTEVSSGGSHSCGIVDGDLYCWGVNSSGQLGIGSTVSQTQPTLVVGALANKTVTAVTAGGSHTCALTSDDTLYCWGDNTYGQLGLGNTTTQSLPQQVATAVSVVSAGTSHTCGVQDGIVYCWGRNNYGQLGLQNYTTATSPQQVKAVAGVFTNSSITAVAAGGSHTCVLQSGVAYCWGLGTSGQLGNGTKTTSTRAVKVSAGSMTNTNVTDITAGGTHTCALKAGYAYCWGNDGYGQIGNGGTNTNVTTPSRVSTITSVSDITAGGYHTCAITSGRAYCWGRNADGQLGVGTTTNSGTPLAVSSPGALGSAGVSAISGGDTHTCLVADGNAYCFGNGSTDGRLGLGGSYGQDITTPASVFEGPRCARDQELLGDGSCSLSAATTYYYRLTFTLDGKTSTTGTWVGLATDS